MSDKHPNPPLAEQTFFTDPSLDRAMGVVMALAAEVWVLKDRQHALETILQQRGHIDVSEVDNYEPEPEANADMAAQRQAYVNALMTNLLGQQQSKGISR